MASTAQLWNLCLVCMTHCATKATPMQFIDGNKLKSHRMGLTNHTWPTRHHITSLVINGLRAVTKRDRHTHILTCEQKRFQETRCTHAAGLKYRATYIRSYIHAYIHTDLCKFCKFSSTI